MSAALQIEELEERRVLATITPKELRISKQRSKWVGDLIWSDGSAWNFWQIAKTKKALIDNARCTFDGPILRVIDAS